MNTRIKTPIGTAWLDEHGILWHRLDFGVRISASTARDTVTAIADLLGDRTAPAIVDIGEMQYATAETREIFARLGASAPEIATAILVRPSDNPASAVQSFLFSKLDSDRPTAIFESEEKAIAWVKGFLPGA